MLYIFRKKSENSAVPQSRTITPTFYHTFSCSSSICNHRICFLSARSGAKRFLLYYAKTVLIRLLKSLLREFWVFLSNLKLVSAKINAFLFSINRWFSFWNRGKVPFFRSQKRGRDLPKTPKKSRKYPTFRAFFRCRKGVWICVLRTFLTRWKSNYGRSSNSRINDFIIK